MLFLKLQYIWCVCQKLVDFVQTMLIDTTLFSFFECFAFVSKMLIMQSKVLQIIYITRLLIEDQSFLAAMLLFGNDGLCFVQEFVAQIHTCLIKVKLRPLSLGSFKNARQVLRLFIPATQVKLENMFSESGNCFFL